MPTNYKSINEQMTTQTTYSNSYYKVPSKRQKLIHLTQREQQVLYLIAHEYTTVQIAQRLYISDHTVISHRKRLIVKLDVKNTAGLIRRGFELGYLRLPPNQ